jgi:hypothetical protein
MPKNESMNNINNIRMFVRVYELEQHVGCGS